MHAWCIVSPRLPAWHNAQTDPGIKVALQSFPHSQFLHSQNSQNFRPCFKSKPAKECWKMLKMAATTIPYHVNATGHGCSSANVRANVFSMKAQRSTAFMCPSPAWALFDACNCNQACRGSAVGKDSVVCGCGSQVEGKDGGPHLPWPAAGREWGHAHHNGMRGWDGQSPTHLSCCRGDGRGGYSRTLCRPVRRVACGVAVAQGLPPPPLPQCRTLPNPPEIGTHHLLQQSRHGPRPPRTRNRARRGRVSTDHVIVQPVICNWNLLGTFLEKAGQKTWTRKTKPQYNR